MEDDLGCAVDLELFERLYRPAVAHEALPDVDDEYNVHRILIGGVVVRYVDRMHSIQMTVEGELPQELTNALTQDLITKLTALENVVCEIVRL